MTATPPPSSPASKAPTWTPHHHLFTTLYHGCLRRDATAMLPPSGSHGPGRISVTHGRPDSDFGRGFYTTTLLRQAEDWAYIRFKGQSLYHQGLPDYQPVVLALRVSRSGLAVLEHLSFVRGDYHADEFWSFVQHCRSGGLHAPPAVMHHERDLTGLATWYDTVSGPVAAFWQQRSAMVGADQYSFHSASAQRLLNDVLERRDGQDYDVLMVKVT